MLQCCLSSNTVLYLLTDLGVKCKQCGTFPGEAGRLIYYGMGINGVARSDMDAKVALRQICARPKRRFQFYDVEKACCSAAPHTLFCIFFCTSRKTCRLNVSVRKIYIHREDHMHCVVDV